MICYNQELLVFHSLFLGTFLISIDGTGYGISAVDKFSELENPDLTIDMINKFDWASLVEPQPSSDPNALPYYQDIERGQAFRNHVSCKNIFSSKKLCHMLSFNYSYFLNYYVAIFSCVLSNFDSLCYVIRYMLLLFPKPCFHVAFHIFILEHYLV